jgi:hypothetical protein
MERIGLRAMPILRGKPLVATAHGIVGNERVDPSRRQRGEIVQYRETWRFPTMRHSAMRDVIILLQPPPSSATKLSADNATVQFGRAPWRDERQLSMFFGLPTRMSA